MTARPHEIYSIAKSGRLIKERNELKAVENRTWTQETYSFTKVFHPATSQHDYFTDTTAPLVDDLISFKHKESVIMTYGASGSGKTYTMEGTAAEPGLLPRAIGQLFKDMKSQPSPHQVAVSSYEVHNDHVVDLLEGLSCPSSIEQGGKENRNKIPTAKQKGTTRFGGKIDTPPGLRVREDSRGRVCIPGLSETVCKTEANVFELHRAATVCKTEAGVFELQRAATVYKTEAGVFELQRAAVSNRQQCSTGTVCMTEADVFELHRAAVSNRQQCSTETVCKTEADVFELHRAAVSNRQQCSTGVNANSSRSHLVFSIKLTEGKGAALGLGPSLAGARVVQVRSSKISFVDLAGCERVARTKNTGGRLKESLSINSSLMTLGRCLETLKFNQGLSARMGSKNSKVVPFRESKITHLFRDILSVNVSPQAVDFEETHHVIKYAALAASITLAVNAPQPQMHTQAGDTIGDGQPRLALENAVVSEEVLSENANFITGLALENAVASEEVLSENANLRDRVAQLEDELARLYQQLQQAESHVYQAEEEIRDVVVSEIQGVIAELRSSHDEQVVAELQSQLDEQDTQLSDAQEEVEDLRRKLAEVAGSASTRKLAAGGKQATGGKQGSAGNQVAEDMLATGADKGSKMTKRACTMDSAGAEAAGAGGGVVATGGKKSARRVKADNSESGATEPAGTTMLQGAQLGEKVAVAGPNEGSATEPAGATMLQDAQLGGGGKVEVAVPRQGGASETLVKPPTVCLEAAQGAVAKQLPHKAPTSTKAKRKSRIKADLDVSEAAPPVVDPMHVEAVEATDEIDGEKDGMCAAEAAVPMEKSTKKKNQRRSSARMKASEAVPHVVDPMHVEAVEATEEIDGEKDSKGAAEAEVPVEKGGKKKIQRKNTARMEASEAVPPVVDPMHVEAVEATEESDGEKDRKGAAEAAVPVEKGGKKKTQRKSSDRMEASEAVPHVVDSMDVVPTATTEGGGGEADVAPTDKEGKKKNKRKSSTRMEASEAVPPVVDSMDEYGKKKIQRKSTACMEASEAMPPVVDSMDVVPTSTTEGGGGEGDAAAMDKKDKRKNSSRMEACGADPNEGECANADTEDKMKKKVRTMDGRKSTAEPSSVILEDGEKGEDGTVAEVGEAVAEVEARGEMAGRKSEAAVEVVSEKANPQAMAQAKGERAGRKSEAAVEVVSEEANQQAMAQLKGKRAGCKSEVAVEEASEEANPQAMAQPKGKRAGRKSKAAVEVVSEEANPKGKRAGCKSEVAVEVVRKEANPQAVAQPKGKRAGRQSEVAVEKVVSNTLEGLLGVEGEDPNGKESATHADGGAGNTGGAKGGKKAKKAAAIDLEGDGALAAEQVGEAAVKKGGQKEIQVQRTGRKSEFAVEKRIVVGTEGGQTERKARKKQTDVEVADAVVLGGAGESMQVDEVAVKGSRNRGKKAKESAGEEVGEAVARDGAGESMQVDEAADKGSRNRGKKAKASAGEEVGEFVAEVEAGGVTVEGKGATDKGSKKRGKKAKAGAGDEVGEAVVEEDGGDGGKQGKKRRKTKAVNV
eukprot:gene12755-16005_t